VLTTCDVLTYKDESTEAIILDCLHTSPGQIHRYLSSIEGKNSVEKNKEAWLKLAYHIIKVQTGCVMIWRFLMSEQRSQLQASLG